MADIDQQDSQDALDNSGENSATEEQDDNSAGEEAPSNGVKKENEESPKEEKTSLKEKSTGNRKTNRFHPYGKEKQSSSGDKKGQSRNRVFISNIPYDMKWQAIKDLMREKVGEVTYVELFKDAEGKSRGCGVVEFKDMEFVTKALDVMNKHDLNGRPLNIKADPDGDHARRALQRGGVPFPAGHNSEMGPGSMSLPPSILNNPNIPPDIISALRAGRLGTTVFVANLDFKVGWKKLKEVFSIAGNVKRADIKEDKDGKSRGMGTVTFEQAIEAVQAISMFNGQFLFDRPMHVKMDDKSIPHDDFHAVESKTPQLPRGLGGIGMGLGPGGQPISATQMGMGNIAPGGMGMDGPGYGGMNRMGASGFGGMEGINNMAGFSGMNRMTDMYRGGMGGSLDRDFGRGDIGLSRGFGDSFGGMSGAMVGGFGGMGSSSMGPLGSGMSSGMSAVNSMSMGLGMDRINTNFDRIGGGLDRNMDMDRGFGGFGPAQMGSGLRDRGNKGCQIFVRNLPFDLTWQKLKEKFNQCGRVVFAEIKMENGKSKGCGTVRFDLPETAEKACRLMNGIKINGREIDVRLDRNA
ncbi:myelin expression factor 2 isoform X2 [Spea bombifrons]|uniref:myelin expression factor 2 isoform X2 n=1 Tax=Spea bombifrons TaxID=233779 RepID=UPI00234B5874|nr:myelin expression factor 2 isoform X2 [Spea bombifrons]